MPDSDAAKFLLLNLHMDDLQDNYKKNMILGLDILSKLRIYLCFSGNTIRKMEARKKDVRL